MRRGDWGCRGFGFLDCNFKHYLRKWNMGVCEVTFSLTALTLYIESWSPMSDVVERESYSPPRLR